MTARDKTTLKTYFNAGDVPTETNFVDLIDSFVDFLNSDVDRLDGVHANQLLRNDLTSQTVECYLTIKKQNSTQEGGQLVLQRADSQEIIYDLNIDFFQKYFRVFENGGSARGAMLDITSLDASAGNRFLTTNGNGVATIPGGILASGSSFPSSPVTGQQFFRSDLGWWCYWNGTYWLTANEYYVSLDSPITTFTVTGTGPCAPIRSDYWFYATRYAFRTRATVLQDASNYWSIVPRSINEAYTSSVNLASFTTVGDAANTWVAHEGSINLTSSSCHHWFDYTTTKTSSAGNIEVASGLYFRIAVA